jgi:hypothetical protein
MPGNEFGFEYFRLIFHNGWGFKLLQKYMRIERVYWVQILHKLFSVQCNT